MNNDKKENKMETVFIRVSKDERKELEKKAKEHGLKLSSFIRMLAIKTASSIKFTL